MPLFEFEAGQLIPAQIGHAVTDPVEPAVLDAVRAQVLEMLRLPVFPVTWRDDDGAPRLTAMDPAGHVVSVEVLERLDAHALVAALGRAGHSAERGWIDVARSYPSGVGAYRRDWNAFRESQPVGTVVTARVHVVAAQIDDDARRALDALAGAGVVVHELAVRQMSSGRLFLDVTEVSVPVAPLPWLLPGRTVAALEAASPALPGPPAAEETEPEPAPAVGRRARRRRAAAASEEAPFADAPAAHAAPRDAAPARADDAAPAHAAPQPAPDGHEPATPDEDLLGIGAMLGEPAALVWARNGHRGEATLRPDGWIVVAGRSFAAPEAAASAVVGEPVAAEAWEVWRFGAEGPSLHEAREELHAVRERERRRAAEPGLRRRRRRAASE
ncbi:restriction system modified-DNA reader domain-containing protein [Georgenia sp. Marseille-Q6866]